MKRFVRWALTPRLNTVDLLMIAVVAPVLIAKGHVVIGLLVATVVLVLSDELQRRFGGGAGK